MNITFESVSLRSGDRLIIDDVTLDLTEHRIGLVGANGSGKSTLARLINGILSPSSGCVRVDGQDVASHGSEARSRIGFVFTNPDSQIVMPTVREDIEFSLRRHTRSGAERRTTAEAAMHRFGLLELADEPSHRLSGGQKQMLALAAIMVTEPDLLIADEPTTLLDARNSRAIADTFAALPQQLIVATHQLESLTDFDRVLVMDAGRVVADDAPAPALSHYRGLISA